MADDTLRRTPLFDRHVALGAKIIPFAGWEMPVQYSGIIAEHNAVRNQAGLFDLGHMGQVDVAGPDALAYLQATTTNDVSTLQPGEAQYAMLPNERGGVIDDILIYRRPEGDGYMVVVNASNRFRDVDWMHEQREKRRELNVSVRDISDETGMIAIQGPNAPAIAQSISGDDLSNIAHYHWRSGTIAGVPVMVARTGYTGEDGFEIYGPIDQAGKVWDALMAAGKDLGLQPIGLGARDTLRLESRMPLYGQELGDDISPHEAGLGWAVKLDKGDFVGREGMAARQGRGTEAQGGRVPHDRAQRRAPDSLPGRCRRDRHRRSDQRCILPDIRREYRAGAGCAGVRGRRQALAGGDPRQVGQRRANQDAVLQAIRPVAI